MRCLRAKKSGSLASAKPVVNGGSSSLGLGRPRASQNPCAALGSAGQRRSIKTA